MVGAGCSSVQSQGSFEESQLRYRLEIRNEVKPGPILFMFFVLNKGKEKKDNLLSKSKAHSSFFLSLPQFGAPDLRLRRWVKVGARRCPLRPLDWTGQGVTVAGDGERCQGPGCSEEHG